MLNQVHHKYIDSFPVGPLEALEGVEVQAFDIDKLPTGLVTGSNLIQFPATATPELKSTVALSLWRLNAWLQMMSWSSRRISGSSVTTQSWKT
jgi:hypothetical protein